jgi:hypothetical protein
MRSRCCPCVCVCLFVFVFVSVYPPIVARQRLGKSPLIVARQRQLFLCGPCRIKGKLAIISSQNFLFCHVDLCSCFFVKVLPRTEYFFFIFVT